MDRGSLDLVHGFKGIAVLARAGKPRLCERTLHACVCVHGGGILRRWLLSGSQLRNNRLKVRAGTSLKGLPTLTFHHPYLLNIPSIDVIFNKHRKLGSGH